MRYKMTKIWRNAWFYLWFGSKCAVFVYVLSVALWKNVLVGKLFHFLGIGFLVQLVRSSMVGIGDNPQFLWLGLGLVEVVHHPSGHVVVLVAMDEKHGQMALLHLLESGGFAKIPIVFPLAQPAGGVHQGKLRQAELFFQLLAELGPYGGISAIIYKAFHVGRLRFAVVNFPDLSKEVQDLFALCPPSALRIPVITMRRPDAFSKRLAGAFLR